MEYNFKDGKAAARAGYTGYDVSSKHTAYVDILSVSRSAWYLSLFNCKTLQEIPKCKIWPLCLDTTRM